MLVVRATAVPAVAGTGPETATDGAEVAGDTASAARAVLEASIAAGQPLSQRELARRFGMPRSRAAVIAREVTTAANGQAPA